MTDSGNRWQKWAVCALLGAAVLAVFSPSLLCSFTDFDDGDYVTFNPDVQRGVTWQGLHWAFATNHAANWHPLTWISHMIDCQIYGLNPVGHHLTSLLLHTANAILLLLLIHRLTGQLWASAWVAAIFALHPLRVESVVWVAERKDVLSTFFWMLTVGAYVRYANDLKFQISNFKFYILALVFFALGLMAKSMLVTLPFVLLLLDYWPLGRLAFGAKFSWRVILEKIPFLLLAIGASVITFLVQNRSGVVASLSSVSLGQRLANIPVAYVRYMGKIFWPSGLAVFYGYQNWNAWQVLGAIFLLGVITLFVVWQVRARPYLAVGWFWFLGMLFPTIGLVTVGHQSMADRYSYLPSVGISIMAAWGARDFMARHSSWWPAAGATALGAVLACAVATPRQIHFWRNPTALFARAAEISDQDSQTCYNVGCEVMEQGDFPRAVRCFERALKVADKSVSSDLLARIHNNLGCVLLEQGQITNAVASFENALKKEAQFPQAYYNMGRAFLTNHQPEVAVECFQQALAQDENPAILGTLAEAYANEGQFPKAVVTAQRARELALHKKNWKLADMLGDKLLKYQGAEVSHP